MDVFLKQSLFRPVIFLRVSLLSVSLLVSIVAFPLTSLYSLSPPSRYYVKIESGKILSRPYPSLPE